MGWPPMISPAYKTLGNFSNLMFVPTKGMIPQAKAWAVVSSEEL